MSSWPKQTAAGLTKFYGRIGTGHTRLYLPENYPMKLYHGPKEYKSFYIHSKCHDSALHVFTKALEHYGADGINGSGMDQYYGCYNPRRMRGGSRWSTHAWACAIDFDASNNPLRWKKDRARLAQPFYDKWWELWEDEGWISLGRSRNFDWMHVQAARL
jgi:hypothetical protein